jgi:hypothetical protein
MQQFPVCLSKPLLLINSAFSLANDLLLRIVQRMGAPLSRPPGSLLRHSGPCQRTESEQGAWSQHNAACLLFTITAGPRQQPVGSIPELGALALSLYHSLASLSDLWCFPTLGRTVQSAFGP